MQPRRILKEEINHRVLVVLKMIRLNRLFGSNKAATYLKTIAKTSVKSDEITIMWNLSVTLKKDEFLQQEENKSVTLPRVLCL